MQSTEDKFRYYFAIPEIKTWYALIADCNSMYGKNWRSKKKMRREYESYNKMFSSKPPPVAWFEVPEERFATYVTLKYGLAIVTPRKAY